MIDILIVTPNFNFGGAEKVSINIANLFIKAGIKTEILTLDATGPLREVISEKIAIHETKAKTSKGSFIEIAKIIKKKNPKIVLSNTVRMNLSVLLGKLLYQHKNVKFFCREPNNPYMTHQSSNCLFKLLFKILYRKADGVIAQNNGMKQDIEKFYKVAPNKIHTIHNPVMVNFKEIPQQEENGYIIYVGRFTKQKNIFALLSAFHLAINKYQVKQKLYMFGDGELRSECLDYIKTNNLTDNVKVFDPILNITDYIAQANCLVLPSLWEGSPNVVFESLSCDTPVLVSPILRQYNEMLTSPKFGKVLRENPDSEFFIDELAHAISLYSSACKTKFGLEFTQNKKVTDYFLSVLDE